MTLEEWAAYKASGRKNITWVGMSGTARIRATLLTVAKTGLRVRVEGRIERWHPDDVRPGWLEC